jgi:hypothetical protein
VKQSSAKQIFANICLKLFLKSNKQVKVNLVINFIKGLKG